MIKIFCHPPMQNNSRWAVSVIWPPYEKGVNIGGLPDRDAAVEISRSILLILKALDHEAEVD